MKGTTVSLFHAVQFKAKDGKIAVYSDGSVGVPKRMRVIPPTDVVDIVVEDGQAASKRLTAARVAAVGVFALAIKKKVAATKYLIVETVDDAHVVELDVKRYGEARSFAAKAMAIVRQGQAAAAEKPAKEAEVPAVEPADDAAPEPKRWWQKTTGDLINERRAKKGKEPLDFSAV